MTVLQPASITPEPDKQALSKELAITHAFGVADKVCDAVQYAVGWGLAHRTLESIRAIGVDEIQYVKGHQYLTMVYQIDQGFTRLLWVGKERTIESFQGRLAQLAFKQRPPCRSEAWT